MSVSSRPPLDAATKMKKFITGEEGFKAIKKLLLNGNKRSTNAPLVRETEELLNSWYNIISSGQPDSENIAQELNNKFASIVLIINRNGSPKFTKEQKEAWISETTALQESVSFYHSNEHSMSQSVSSSASSSSHSGKNASKFSEDSSNDNDEESNSNQGNYDLEAFNQQIAALKSQVESLQAALGAKEAKESEQEKDERLALLEARLKAIQDQFEENEKIRQFKLEQRRTQRSMRPGSPSAVSASPLVHPILKDFHILVDTLKEQAKTIAVLTEGLKTTKDKVKVLEIELAELKKPFSQKLVDFVKDKDPWYVTLALAIVGLAATTWAIAAPFFIINSASGAVSTAFAFLGMASFASIPIVGQIATVAVAGLLALSLIAYFTAKLVLAFSGSESAKPSVVAQLASFNDASSVDERKHDDSPRLSRRLSFGGANPPSPPPSAQTSRDMHVTFQAQPKPISCSLAANLGALISSPNNLFNDAAVSSSESEASLSPTRLPKNFEQPGANDISAAQRPKRRFSDLGLFDDPAEAEQKGAQELQDPAVKPVQDSSQGLGVNRSPIP